MPSLIKITLALVFHLKHSDDLGMGQHQFCLGKHTFSVWKVLKACVDQHQVIAGGRGSPTLSDAAYLTAPDGFTLPDTLAMACSTHAHLWVVLDTLLGRYHPAAQGIDALVLALIE